MSLMSSAVQSPQATLAQPVQAPVVKVPEKPARLIVVSTNFARQEFLLEKATVVIGRTDDNDVVLNHRSISRHHSKIVREAALYRELVASGTIKEQSEMISGALSATLNVSAGIQPQFAAAALTVTAD